MGVSGDNFNLVPLEAYPGIFINSKIGNPNVVDTTTSKPYVLNEYSEGDALLDSLFVFMRL